MTRVRLALVAALASLAIGAVLISDAVAAPASQGSANVTTVAPLYKLPITGMAKDGKQFRGTYGIQRFVVAKVHGKRGVYAVGTLTGRFHGQRVSRNNVMVPASLAGGNSMGTTNRSTRQASCTILHLVLGPINLNLLGVTITLGGGAAANQPIVLDVTAHQGQGLLGDLLCGIDNALGGTGVLSQLSSQLQALSSTLNSIISLLSGL
jgi:hypothetical protein